MERISDILKKLRILEDEISKLFEELTSLREDNYIKCLNVKLIIIEKQQEMKLLLYEIDEILYQRKMKCVLFN